MIETQNAEYFKCSADEADYCRKCWDEFTKLTPEEHDIFNPDRKKRYSDYVFVFENTGKIYHSLQEASNDLGIKKATIYAILTGRIRKNKQGYVFRYL